MWEVVACEVRRQPNFGIALIVKTNMIICNGERAKSIIQFMEAS